MLPTYDMVRRDYGRALDRLAAGYEADSDKRRDLRQQIHLQLWRSLASFDGNCSLQTWTFRVAHNTAASYVIREQRHGRRLVSLEEAGSERVDSGADASAKIDQTRTLLRLSQLIYELKPLDRQIMLMYLEEMDSAEMAAVTGLCRANISMKIYRIKNLLARNFHRETNHA